MQPHTNWSNKTRDQRPQSNINTWTLNHGLTKLWRIALLVFAIFGAVALLAPSSAHAQGTGYWESSYIPGDAFPASNSGLYVCRGYYRDGTHIGSIWDGDSTCLIGWGGREVALSNFEVLAGVPNASWRSGTTSIPRGALIGGYHNDGTTHYVCRGLYAGGYRVGKTSQGRCNIGWGGEVRLSSFEVLVPAAEPPPPIVEIGGSTVYDYVTSTAGDRYAFYGYSGDWVEIRMGSSDMDTYLDVYSPDGTWLASNDDYDGTNSRVLLENLPTTGRYTIVARGYNGDTGSYWVRID